MSARIALEQLTAGGRALARHRPWPRIELSAPEWSVVGQALAEGSMSLLTLWAESDCVHAAVCEDGGTVPAVLSLACPGRRFPSLGARHPPAIRLERAIADLFGLAAIGTPDARPWLDHGQWAVRQPLAPATGNPPRAATDYPFLPVEGNGLHEIPVGPVHAGIIEPGHFRFTASGETVVRLEERLGYVHKGIEGLIAGAPLPHAAKLAARTSGDSTVAYSLAFARAVEAALDTHVPPRAVWLRALMAELERIANHIGDVGAVCNDAAFAIMHAHCGYLREQVLRAAAAAFGHRLMMDCIVPGGTAADLDSSGADRLARCLELLARRMPDLVALYEKTSSLQDRTCGTGIVAPGLVRQWGAGGYVGRASGRAFDARRQLCYPPYGDLDFDVPVLETGDVDARVRIRLGEIGQSLALVRQILAKVPLGEARAAIAAADEVREGVAVVEAFRGDVLVWLRIAPDGTVLRCHLRDPSWFQWPLLEAAIEGNIVADFPLCNKSFNCSYSGHDL